MRLGGSNGVGARDGGEWLRLALGSENSPSMSKEHRCLSASVGRFPASSLSSRLSVMLTYREEGMGCRLD